MSLMRVARNGTRHDEYGRDELRPRQVGFSLRSFTLQTAVPAQSAWKNQTASTATPPMYGRKASGTVTLPSAF
jgi:hypothetical protein